MSHLEQELKENTEAVKALTAALLATAGAAQVKPAAAAEKAAPADKPADAEKKGPGRPKKEEAKKAAVTFADVVPHVTALGKDNRDGRGRAGVQALLKKYLPDAEKPTGDLLKGLNDPAVWEAAIADAKALLETGVLPGSEEGGDGELDF